MNKKRIFVIVLIIIGIFTDISSAWALEAVSNVSIDYITSADGEWHYKLQDGEIYLQDYLGDAVHLEIPEKIDGYTVRGIGFTVLFLNNYTLKSVSLPSTINSIAAGVFNCAYALESITIDKDFTTGFHSVDGVLYNGNQLVAYPSAKKGENYIIPDGTETIQAYAFYGCSDLKKVVVPQSVYYLGKNAFSRSVQATDIVIKRPSFSTSYIDGVCWEMAAGTRFLVKSEELRNAVASEMTDKNGYKDSTETMEVEVIEPVPASSLTFTDGSTEQNITISYTDTGYSGDPVNEFNLQTLYQQLPADTTENVTWSLVRADTCPEVALTNNPNEYICQVTASGMIITYAGGNAVLKGMDESGHEIVLNVKVYHPLESCEIATNKDAKMRVRVNESIHEGIVISPRKSYAYNVGTKWEIEDTGIATIDQKTPHGCDVTGVDVGTTTLTVAINDNGNLIKKEIEVTVSDYIRNCTIDPIPPQIYVGEHLMPKPIVRYKGRVLTEGVDYVIDGYGDNNIPGKNMGWISINGLGTTFLEACGWEEYLTISFDIVDGRSADSNSGSGTVNTNPSAGDMQDTPGQGTINDTQNGEIDVNAGETQQITGIRDNYTKIYGSGSFNLKAVGANPITYTSSNKKIVTVGATSGKVSIKGIGRAVITLKSGDLKKKVTVTVLPRTPKKVKAKITGKGIMHVTWKKDKKVTGYQIQCALNKKFSKGKRLITIKKANITSCTVRKLKSKKKYYIRLRAYKTVKGKKYYSNWIKPITVKT